MSFDAESSRRAAGGDVPASIGDTAPPAPAPTGRRQGVQVHPMTVQPVLYSSALNGPGPLLPSVDYATPGRAPALSGHGRTKNDRQRMRQEIMALARSPSCWRPLMVFVFSLVIGATLALAAYGIRGSRLRRGGGTPRRGNGTY
ncbi:hypothetical protein MRX96_032944 [Rhipicephalus microplus]